MFVKYNEPVDKNTSIPPPLVLPKLLMRAKQVLLSVAEKYGLTSMQLCMLILIEPEHPKTMTSLARILNNDASNITGLADRLERQKLIVRQDKPEDRRIKIISLTPSGQKLRTDIKKSLAEAEASLLGNLSDPEKQTFRDLLYKL